MNFLKNIAESCGALWGEGSVSITLADRYKNVANSLEGDAGFPIDIAKLAGLRAQRH
ncbi:peptidase T [Grimontia indica]|uniref:Peptidase T n=1 Tax=Grimontia indica TaxID=1056512 RepID=R1I8L8_9GAMM|nr:peptidase T [Grimontia indica]